MPHIRRRILRLAPVIAVAMAPSLMLAACAKDNDIDLATYVEQTDPPDVLYNQGLANLNAGRLKEAAAKFSAIDRQHPYSQFARKAMVMGAFTNYRRGNYDEAISSAERFVSLYPTDEDAAYAQYIVGLAWYRQIRDVTQDQKEAIRTMNAMKELVERWPDSEYVEDAQTKIRLARDQLAGKEMQIGRYYQERREYVAAITRFRNVVEVYSDTRHIEEALARLTETYYAMGMVSEAQTAAAVLGHNFPDSEWYQTAYKLLRQGNLEPREDGGSWLAKVSRTLTGGA